MSNPTLDYASPGQHLTWLDRAGRFVGKLATMFGWYLLGLVLVAGVAVGATAAVGGGGLGGGLAMGYGVLFALLLLMTWGLWRRITRSRRVDLLLSHLQVGVVLNLPLPLVLSSAASAETGRVRRQLLHLRDALLAGQPIGTALADAAPELPARTLDTITAAERNGTLGRTLGQLTRQASGPAAAAKARSALQGVYAFLTMAFGLTVVSLVMVYVAPRFDRIFKDFKLDLPWEMKVVLNIAREGKMFFTVLMSLVPLVLLVLAAGAMRSIFTPARPRAVFRPLRDCIRWWLPITHQLDRDRGLADVCDTFADGIAAGRPAPGALDVANLPSLNRMLADKLAAWSLLLHAGRPLHESAVAARLPRMFGVLLAPGFAADGSAEALRFLARCYRDRNERLLAVLRAAVGPATTLLLGGAVLLLTMGIFRSISVVIFRTFPTTVMP